jgi:hypothetical protein
MRVFLKNSMVSQATIRNFLTEYYSGNQVKEYEMGGACGTYGERRSAYRVEVVKLGRKRPL